MEKQNLKKQFPINLISNFVYFVLSVLIGIWFTPYLIKHLGVAVYGLVPLAMSVIDYMGIMTTSFNSAVARFLTIGLHKEDEIEANKTFNTALWSSLLFIISVMPVLILCAYFSPKIFNIPSGQEYNSQIFFTTMVVVFSIYAISSNFLVSSFAVNRFDLRNIIKCSDIVVRVLIIVFLFSFSASKLWFVSSGYLGGALATLVGAIFVWRILTPNLKISFRNFDKSKLSNLTHMSGWVLFDQIGTVLFLSTELILVNRLCGSEAAGQYAVILPWVILLRAMSDIVSSTLTPMYFAYYAKGEIANIVNLLKKSIKFLGLFLALPVGLICGFASSLLTVWVGPSFAGLAPLMCILIGHLVFSLAILPVFAIQVTFNKVRIPAIVTFVIGVCQVVLAVFFVRVFNWGFYGIALAAVLSYLLRNIGFSLIYVAKILKIDIYACFVSLAPGIISMLVVAAASFFLEQVLRPGTWLVLLCCGISIALMYLYVIVKFILNPEEKKLFLSVIPIKKIA
ncbi:MAG: oligosaccharide flippase family protein [Candidatus Omnitrophica bacterium]|nr:oligosaccharide flippase family protein [Candidatus Omnitrophota bacterium]